MRRITMVAMVAAFAAATPAHAGPLHPLASETALGAPLADQGLAAFAPSDLAGLAGAGSVSTAPQAFTQRSKTHVTDTGDGKSHPSIALSPERARVLLQSMTVPGWGQLTMGHPTAAAVFGTIEAAIWTTYASFRIQNEMRRDSYMHTAQAVAGINLRDRDEEFQRIVGSYISSDEYNQLVVARDAANQYYDDPAAMRAYIDEHSLKGSDTWTWPDDAALERYRGQRKDATRAANRANSALALAIVNRLLSVIHVARLHEAAPAPQGWQLRATPDPNDLTAFRMAMERHF